MTSQADQNEICVIRTFECELCLRFDSVMMTKEELIFKVSSNEMGIGTHLISHGDHNRIIYFNVESEYLGDIISLNIQSEIYKQNGIDLPIFHRPDLSLKNKMQLKFLRTFLKNNQKLTIIGPSYVGKTSLTVFLETGIPERNNGFVRRSPTLQKSVKHLKIGISNVVIYDMGGQKDYWDGWEKEISDASKIIFMADGTANNVDESTNAFQKLLDSRISNVSVLFLINKYDLVLDGYTTEFLEDRQITANVNRSKLDNIWVLKASVFNGICYNYNNDSSETSLIKVISDFINLK